MGKLDGKVAIVTGASQGSGYGAELQMSTPSGLSVGIDKVDMPQVLPRLPQGTGQTGFLDIHVKQIGQQFHRLGFQGPQ